MLELTGSVHVAPHTESLFDALGESLMSGAVAAVEQRGVFHVALSGGGTPEPFYVRLVTDPKFRALPWKQTHVWIVDERRVDEDDEKSNVKMIREALTDHVGMPSRQVHAMPVLAEDPAGEYEATLGEAFGMEIPKGAAIAEGGAFDGAYPKLDFVLLGMGGDCHTASLFPESPALGATRWIEVNDGEKVVPPARLTMTYPLINHARQVAVLAVGEGKAAALHRVAMQSQKGAARHPKHPDQRDRSGEGGWGRIDLVPGSSRRGRVGETRGGWFCPSRPRCYVMQAVRSGRIARTLWFNPTTRGSPGGGCDGSGDRRPPAPRPERRRSAPAGPHGFSDGG